MKFFRYLLFATALIFTFISCKKETENKWKIDIKEPATKVQVEDISKEFYDPNVTLAQFRQKYPWFQGTVPDEDYSARRTDSATQKIYKEAISKIDIAKLNSELTDLFSHVKFYFPEFKQPKVYLYSSELEAIMNPVFYQQEQNMIFIDISAFMGENNPNYKGLENYFQTSMNPQNIVPKVSEILAENFVPRSAEHQKFIDKLVYNGKIMILQDAFLPEFPDYLKMNYTQKQYDWAKANEAHIWNFFVEGNLLFNDDTRLNERFIKPGPFSKFYTEIDNESSPQIGIFTGWQICKKFFEKKPETTLQDFLKMNVQDIFNQSNYKPKAE